MGLSQEERFHRYHRVLSRASWSSVKASRMLLGLLVGAFADALALVCKELWAQEQTFCGSLREADTLKVPRQFVERLTDALCYAA